MEWKKVIEKEELQYLESRYRAQLDSSDDDFDNVKFSYAWGLIRSQQKDDIRRGISLLEELRFTDSTRDRECRYYIAVGYFKLGRYADAKNYLAPLIRAEPANEQFVNLQSDLDHYINRDGILGMAIVGGVAALAAGLFIGFARRKN